MKLRAIFLVLLLVASFAGCTKKPPAGEEKAILGDEQKPVKGGVAEEDPATQDISYDLAQIEVLKKDLNTSDLDGLENDLDAIVW